MPAGTANCSRRNCKPLSISNSMWRSPASPPPRLILCSTKRGRLRFMRRKRLKTQYLVRSIPARRLGFEDAVREPIVAHELPDVLDRIELGRFRWQRQERDVVWDGKPLRDMPSRLIKKKNGVRAGRDCKRDFLQMQGHGLAVAGG